MSDYIIQKARQDVWCTPIMDSQVRIKINRATPPQGVRGNFSTSMYSYQLPDVTNKWSVFKLGRIYIGRFGINLQQLTWYSLKTLANRNNVFIELYSDEGLAVTRGEAFLMESDTDGIYVAVKETVSTFELFPKEALYLRFYDNAFFSTQRASANPRAVEIIIPKNTTQLQYGQAIALFNAYKQKTGYVYGMINGRFSTNVNALTLKIGDYVEFVYDSSVKKVVQIPINGLNTFTSEMDLKDKYLVHHPSLNTGIIEYHDDIDVFLVSGNNNKRGVIYPKNEMMSMRNLTHCDYSMPADHISMLAAKHPNLLTPDNCTLLLLVRNSGYARPLIHEASRIHELKKLPYQANVNAMLGIDSNVSVWQASNLEKSQYIKVMNSPWGDITKDRATRMYGYNGMAKVLADTPQNKGAGQNAIILPEGLSRKSVVYEFTSDGTLLDFYQHANSPNYVVRNATCRYIEAVMGDGSDSLQQNVDVLSGTLDPGMDVRFYRANKISGVPQDPFTEILPGPQLNKTDTTYTWLISASANRLLVRREDKFLAYKKSIPLQGNRLHFRITSREFLAGLWFESDVKIPTLKLDLWLNKRALIEGIDYHVKWPEVYIVSKSYLVPGVQQEVTVRAYGLSNTSEMRDVPKEWGFVSYGTLSRNGAYDLHEGRLLHIVVDGKVKRREDIRIEESSDTLIVNDALNGKPYLLAEIMPVLGNYSSIKTMALRDMDQSVEDEIKTYMTHKLPETPPEGPSFKAARYPLVSVYIATILSEMQNGSISAAFVNSEPSTQQIVEELDEYEELLYFDPTQDFNNFDVENIQILSHYQDTPVTVTFQQWQILDKVNKHYLFGRVDMSRSYVIA